VKISEVLKGIAWFVKTKKHVYKRLMAYVYRHSSVCAVSYASLYTVSVIDESIIVNKIVLFQNKLHVLSVLKSVYITVRTCKQQSES